MENISLQCIYTLYVQICTILYSLRNTEMQLSIHPCWYCILLTHFSHQCKDNQNFQSVSRFFFQRARSVYQFCLVHMCQACSLLRMCRVFLCRYVLIYAVLFFFPLSLGVVSAIKGKLWKAQAFQGTAVTHVLILFSVSLQQNNKILARSPFFALYVSGSNNTSLHEVLAASNIVQQQAVLG